MADDKKYYYMRLKENFFEDDAMLILESMPDGLIYSNILLKLYLKSLKYNGKLMFNDRIPYNSTMLATITRQQVGTVERALRIFVDMGLIEIMDSGAIYMMDIQSYIGKSSTEADRVREYRKRINAEKKMLPEGDPEPERLPEPIPDDRNGVQMYGQMQEQKNVQMYDKDTPEKEIEKEIKKELKREGENAGETPATPPPPSKRFKPPTLEEVRAYCTERGNNVDPQRFIDYYTANGWKVGRNAMKDWRASVRTWEQREKQAPPRQRAQDERSRIKNAEEHAKGGHQSGIGW